MERRHIPQLSLFLSLTFSWRFQRHIQQREAGKEPTQTSRQRGSQSFKLSLPAAPGDHHWDPFLLDSSVAQSESVAKTPSCPWTIFHTPLSSASVSLRGCVLITNWVVCEHTHTHTHTRKQKDCRLECCHSSTPEGKQSRHCVGAVWLVVLLAGCLESLQACR